jgi:hypothetical protein
MRTEMQGLLSIDADAHLQKLTAHMFPSPALLPVELVRSALKRRAAAIAVQVRAERIVICDDGTGIAAAEWEALACLADALQSPVARERAMALLQEPARPGIGLLAVFCPGVRSLQVENVDAAGKSTLRIVAGRVGRQVGCAWARGTRITIVRRRGPAAEEKTLLNELCAAARAEISVNGGLLKKKPLLAEALVYQEIAFGETGLPSALSIPIRGDVCRLWLLDQGIPWQAIAMAPVRGVLFAAALETGDRPTPAALQTLAARAAGLYRWLAENYGQFPEPFQSRIDDLFFRQARSGPDLGLLSLCAPFRIWHSSRSLNLAEVRRQAASGSLYFSASDWRPGSLSGSVLKLTALQKDFLINHLHLPMINLGARPKAKARPRRFRDFCRRQFAGIGRTTAAFHVEIPGEENEFCRELETHWQLNQAAAARETAALPLSVVMIRGRGLFPAYRLKSSDSEVLHVRRRHPLTLRALRKFNQDHDNGALAFAALFPGHF